jgi:DNA-binding NarL/FixJ family response regulator
MRQGLRTILELEPGFQVVGEAADGEEAVRRYHDLQTQGNSPDIVLMDIQMPRMSGVQATAVLTSSDPSARVIILTTFDYEEYVFEAIKAGAMGYLLKDVPADELVATIRQVYAGEPSIQPKIAEELVLAEGTVKNHVSNILSKLHTENRTQAAYLARERKLL